METKALIGIVALLVVAILVVTMFSSSNAGQVIGGTVKDRVAAPAVRPATPNLFPIPGTEQVAFPAEPVFYAGDAEGNLP